MTRRGEAALYDGTAPLARPVIVALGADSLAIASIDGAPIADWRLRDIDLVDRRPETLTVARRGGEARLRIGDMDVAAALLAALGPGLRRRGLKAAAVWAASGLALVAAVALFLGFAWPLLADRLAAALPEDLLGGLADHVTLSVIAGQPRCEAPEAVAILRKLAVRLAEAAGREPPEIVVVKSEVANAYALPGNRIIVLSRLITDAEHQNEIAGVLAHEIGHLHHNHPARQLVRHSGLFLLVELFTGGSSFGTLSALAVAAGYSRDFEHAADAFAHDLLRATRIDGRPVARFFERVAKEEKRQGLLAATLGYLSTHPASTERAAAFERLSPAYAAIAYADFPKLKKICGG